MDVKELTAEDMVEKLFKGRDKIAGVNGASGSVGGNGGSGGNGGNGGSGSKGDGEGDNGEVVYERRMLKATRSWVPVEKVSTSGENRRLWCHLVFQGGKVILLVYHYNHS